MISFNLPDPTEQERVRRRPHKYVAEAGVHGRYVANAEVGNTAVVGYTHQEYPKVMDRTPYPELRDFKGKQDAEILLEHSRKAWDQRQTQSIVNSKVEEEKWIAAHANDPVLTPGAYPKTMDKTPPPRADECAGLEDYRARREAWRDQKAASIVHDEIEEQLWLEEHEAEEQPKKRKVKVKAA